MIAELSAYLSGVDASGLLHPAARLVVVLALSAVSYFVTRGVLVRGLTRFIQRTRTELDDILLEAAVLPRLSLLVPAVVVFFGADFLPGPSQIIRQVVLATMTFLGVMLVGALLSAFDRFYARLDSAERIPLKSYIQIVKIGVYILGTLAALAILVGESPMVLLTSVGAMTAVLLLIFRDTILSLVASLQITSQNLVREGDWIEAPSAGADGDVMDISLHTIRVQNWDKTITTIPTHKLIDNSFKNWRGMQESGGRRIKRSINIDMNSIRFCDDDMLRRFSRFALIADYLSQRTAEVAEYNAKLQVDSSELLNNRRLTNVGTFRAYVAAYLKNHPSIDENLTFLVRQLAPGQAGLPIEIYVFANDTRWANYEGIQADIFDHLLAVVREFDLRVFQTPTGGDVRTLAPRT